MPSAKKLTKEELERLVQNIKDISKAQASLMNLDKTIQKQKIDMPAVTETLSDLESRISKLEQEKLEICNEINRLATIIADDVEKLSNPKLSRKQKKELFDLSLLNAKSREAKKIKLNSLNASLKDIERQHKTLKDAKDRTLKLHSEKIEERYDLISNYNKMAIAINWLTNYYFNIQTITEFEQIANLKPTPTLQDLNEYLSSTYITIETCEEQNQ